MFRGAITALVTPFDDDLEVDYDAYGRLVDFQLEGGIDGLVPCGCTGEAATLAHEEQKRCIRFVVERVAADRSEHPSAEVPGRVPGARFRP
ncbi:MAG: dihydrodipicolinate synthase family protein, partial [Planctomycetes bacterium]|nr:dihydrodipicolinate synthase family protein [Planctomycetota bacterium]